LPKLAPKTALAQNDIEKYQEQLDQINKIEDLDKKTEKEKEKLEKEMEKLEKSIATAENKLAGFWKELDVADNAYSIYCKMRDYIL